jgi:hypothetical protein
MTPTFRPEKSAFLWRTAAAPATPDGSISTFIRSSIQERVSIISSSDTSRTAFTVSCTIGKVSFPGEGTWRPSAIVRGISMVTRSPFASDMAVSLAVSGSTP